MSVPPHRSGTRPPGRPNPTLERTIRARLLVDADHYEELIRKLLEDARFSVWIATANVKEMRVPAPIGSRARAGGRFVSILETLVAQVSRGLDVRLLHGGTPSRPFRSELARLRPRLGAPSFPMRQCPRVHLKMIAVDGRALYLGSANFTGAGLGAKGDGRRNFEMGIVTDDDGMLDRAQERFHRIWSGTECAGCKLRGECPAPIDLRHSAARAGSQRRRRAL